MTFPFYLVWWPKLQNAFSNMNSSVQSVKHTVG